MKLSLTGKKEKSDVQTHKSMNPQKYDYCTQHSTVIQSDGRGYV